MTRNRGGSNQGGAGSNNGNHKSNNNYYNHSGNNNKINHERTHGNKRGQGNNNGNGPACSWCGKNNHPPNKCFFNPNNPKNLQAGQNGKKQQNQHGSDRNQSPQKNQGLRKQNNNQRPNHKNNHVQSLRPSNGNNFCTFCSRKGHQEDTCHKKNPHAKSQQKQGGPQPKMWLRPLSGSAKDHLGNGTAYQQPLRLVRKEIFKSSWYQGQEFQETTLDEYMVDCEEDVLMCSCPGWSSEWCIHNCASNLFAQNGQKMWVSDRDRAVIEQGMLLNYCPRKHGAYEDAALL